MGSCFSFLCRAGEQGLSGGADSTYCCIQRGEMLTVVLLHKLQKEDWCWTLFPLHLLQEVGRARRSWRSLRVDMWLRAEVRGVGWGQGRELKGEQANLSACLSWGSSSPSEILSSVTLWAAVTVDKLGTVSCLPLSPWKTLCSLHSLVLLSSDVLTGSQGCASLNKKLFLLVCCPPWIVETEEERSPRVLDEDGGSLWTWWFFVSLFLSSDSALKTPRLGSGPLTLCSLIHFKPAVAPGVPVFPSMLSGSSGEAGKDRHSHCQLRERGRRQSCVNSCGSNNLPSTVWGVHLPKLVSSCAFLKGTNASKSPNPVACPQASSANWSAPLVNVLLVTKLSSCFCNSSSSGPVPFPPCILSL